VGLGLEARGAVGMLIRDPNGDADFIDTSTGQKWDVKGFNSYYKPKGYNLSDAITNIKKSISKNEYVMLDTRKMFEADVQELMAEIVRRGWQDKVLIWP